MTSRTDSFPAAYAPARRFAWGRLGFTFAVTLSAIMVFGASFAVGYARMNEVRVLHGVEVADGDLAGLTTRTAGAKLREKLPRLSDGELAVRVGDVVGSIPHSDLNRDYDIDYMLAQAFE